MCVCVGGGGVCDHTWVWLCIKYALFSTLLYVLILCPHLAHSCKKVELTLQELAILRHLTGLQAQRSKVSEVITTEVKGQHDEVTYYFGNICEIAPLA